MSDSTLPTTDDTTDPTGITRTIIAAVTTLIALAVAFGVPLAEEQQAAVLSVVAILAPVLAMAWVRRTAWRPSSVAAAVEADRQL